MTADVINLDLQRKQRKGASNPQILSQKSLSPNRRLFWVGGGLGAILGAGVVMAIALAGADDKTPTTNVARAKNEDRRTGSLYSEGGEIARLNTYIAVLEKLRRDEKICNSRQAWSQQGAPQVNPLSPQWRVAVIPQDIVESTRTQCNAVGPKGQRVMITVDR